MLFLIHKYAQKLVDAGLAAPDDLLVGGMDAQAVWNRQTPESEALLPLMQALGYNSLVYANPAQPYADILQFLAARSNGSICPQDCETRTFLHDLPVIRQMTPEALLPGLKARKGVIVAPEGQRPAILTYGTVSPEQAFVTFCSICFACFVKFFSDYLVAYKSGLVEPDMLRAMELVAAKLPAMPQESPRLRKGPFHSRQDVYAAMQEAGRATVSYGLVDSYFGNISCLYDGTLYISQSGSSLDELEGYIDPVPMDGSSCTGLTASSELSAHMEALRRSGRRLILHGHPRFTVILSMDCSRTDCDLRGECHIKCAHKRDVLGVPVVPGEVGTGQYGLCNTLPPALEDHPAAIVYGHGLFAMADDDYNQAFAQLLQTELACCKEYFSRIGLPFSYPARTEG